MQLFQESKSSHNRPKRVDEPLFSFLSESDSRRLARRFWQETLESCELTDSDCVDVVKRFRSSSDEQHLGALFELFLQRYFHDQGIPCRRPEPCCGSRPDFRLEINDDLEVLVEATCQFGKSAQLSDNDKWRGQAIDVIRHTKSCNFRVGMRVRGNCQETPDLKYIKREFDFWLSRLDHAKLLQMAGGVRSCVREIELRMEVDGLLIQVWPIPLPTPSSSVTHGLVAWQSGDDAYLVVTGLDLRSRLEQKAKQLPKGVPSIVAVNIIDPHLDHEEILFALYGSPNDAKSQFGTKESDSSERRRKRGFFQFGGRPAHTRVGAILIFHQLEHGAVPQSQPLLIRNPDSSIEFPELALTCAKVCVPSGDKRDLIETDGNALLEDDDWYDNWPYKTTPE